MQGNLGARSSVRRQWRAAALGAVLVLAAAMSALPAAAAPFLYVANTNSSPGVVSLIDTATNTRVPGGIVAGKTPFGIAVAPDGLHVYVTNPQSNTVSVADTATNKKVVAITVGTYPVGVAVSPDATRAYVTNRASNPVSVIATATNTVVANNRGVLAAGGRPHTGGSACYVTSRFSNIVSVIATATNTVVKTIIVGTNPPDVAITPDGTHAYVDEFGLQHGLGDRHGHQHGGEDGGGRVKPQPDRHHSGWQARLCHEFSLQHRFGNRHGHKYGFGDHCGRHSACRGRGAPTANRPMSRIISPAPFRQSTRPPTRWWRRSRWALVPRGSPLFRRRPASLPMS